jgi:C3HC zinc finger-like
MDTLRCTACKATLAFTASDALHGNDASAAVDDFLSELSQKHSSYCIWHAHQPTSHDVLAFPSAQPEAVCEAFVGRVAELGQLEAMPYLGGYGMALLSDRCLNQLLALLETPVVPIPVRISLRIVMHSHCMRAAAYIRIAATNSYQ